MIGRRIAVGLVLISAALAAGCGVPNLETTECTEARDAARRFYSFHFGNDMIPLAENLKQRRRFLTPEYFDRLTAANAGDIDPFTMSAEPPRTFKIGVCRQTDPAAIDMQIQLYWRDDKATVQREVTATLARSNGEWLISKVSKVP